MFYIFLKIILCSSLLIGVYHLLLEKEKMYQFNRFFLLFSLAFSYSVPFISITTKAPVSKGNPQLIFEETAQQILSHPVEQEDFNWINVIWVLYAIITLALLVKALISITKIFRIKGETISHDHYKIVVTEDNFSPFTFGKTIYLSKSYLDKGEIDPRIFLHEKSHLDQKHSWDLFIIEIIKIFTWFNPAVYFYKKTIITNHEFLADDAVLENNFNAKDYQTLILNEIINCQKLEFTHSFNFNNTKKRFIMMNTKKSKFTWLKKAISLPILVTAFGLFVQKTYANSSISNIDISKENEKTSSTNPLHKIAPEQENTSNKAAITDTIRPTKKAAVKKAKTNRNSDFPPPPPPAVEKPKVKKANMSQNPDIPPPPPPSTAFSPAKFPAGINELRSKIVHNFNAKVLNGNEGNIKSEIFISIKEDGTVDKVTANGNNKVFNDEVSRTIKSVTENVKWDPATENGKPIATVFRLPITMSFEP